VASRGRSPAPTAESRPEAPAGKPVPARRDLRRVGTNFAIYSEAAERVALCLFDRDGTETRTPLTEMAAWVGHGYAFSVGLGQR
jgi:glycogen operon protein